MATGAHGQTIAGNATYKTKLKLDKEVGGGGLI